MENIVEQTNLYAQQTMGESAFATWTQVTTDELWAYLGFCILMAVNHLPSMSDYWSTDEVYHYSPVAGRISRKRFFDISRYLHFVDNTTLPARNTPSYHRLQKVSPVIDAVMEACMTAYNPSKNNSIDEAMIAFKGRASIKQYMPKKPVKRGIKVWMRSDSSNGYISQFDVYTGKSGNDTEGGLGENVVKRLTRAITGKYHCVYMDNFFTSVPLFFHLLQENIYACGTLRSNRRYLPDDLRKVMTKGVGERGEYVYRQDGNLVVTVWQDTKPVSMLSTNWDPTDTVKVNRKRKDGSRIEVNCPNVVDTYNKFMGGVDRGDQYRRYYELRTKSRKVYKYIFWFLIEVCLLNTFILHRYSPSTGRYFVRFKDFRVELAKMLIGDYNGRKRRGRPPRALPAPTPKKPNLAHFPRKTNKGRCMYCQGQGKRKETTWLCRGCGIRLCHTGVDSTDCFANYHIECGIYESQ